MRYDLQRSTLVDNRLAWVKIDIYHLYHKINNG